MGDSISKLIARKNELISERDHAVREANRLNEERRLNGNEVSRLKVRVESLEKSLELADAEVSRNWAIVDRFRRTLENMRDYDFSAEYCKEIAAEILQEVPHAD